jgi:hypothetical protein
LAITSGGGRSIGDSSFLASVFCPYANTSKNKAIYERIKYTINEFPFSVIQSIRGFCPNGLSHSGAATTGE